MLVAGQDALLRPAPCAQLWNLLPKHCVHFPQVCRRPSCVVGLVRSVVTQLHYSATARGLTEDPLIKTACIFTARSLGRRISCPSGCPPTQPPSLLSVSKGARLFIARAIEWLINGLIERFKGAGPPEALGGVL